MKRTLTKSERIALWLASGGVCAGCGMELDASFHADHVIPWSITHDTNIHDMQALCAPCNLKKGDKMFRQHQEQANRISADILCGTSITTIIAGVTPGGGKSFLPVIIARNMIGRTNPQPHRHGDRADAICWVVPRDSLRTQGEEAFTDPYLRSILSHELTARASTNDTNPCRGHAGYITTYNAIATAPQLHAEEFRRRRYILVLDEPHHIVEGGSWYRALKPLVERATLVVLMSGTFERADGQPIAFLPYVPGEKGKMVFDIDRVDDPSIATIRYGRQSALSEKAILPIYFERLDGEAKWKNRDGDECEVTSLRLAGDYSSSALYTALRTDYANQLLDTCVNDWLEYRQIHPRSKLLVVAPDIRQAKKYLHIIRSRGLTTSDIAVSDDDKSALENIKRYKGRSKLELDILVTVQIAYEGLDVPAITHIACLTHIRSAPWIEQMIARATRYDRNAGEWEIQAAFIYHPDDAMFAAAVEKIKAEQAPFIRLPEDKEPPGKPSEPLPPIQEIRPLAAVVTTQSAASMQSDEVINHSEYQKLKSAAKAVGFGGVSVLKLKEFLQELNKSTDTPDPVSATNGMTLTISEQEDLLRSQIAERVNQYCKGDKDHIIETNKIFVVRYRKKREELTLKELEDLWRYIVANLPLAENSRCQSA